jgi:hypothetical protein
MISLRLTKTQDEFSPLVYACGDVHATADEKCDKILLGVRRPHLSN